MGWTVQKGEIERKRLIIRDRMGMAFAVRFGLLLGRCLEALWHGFTCAAAAPQLHILIAAGFGQCECFLQPVEQEFHRYLLLCCPVSTTDDSRRHHEATTSGKGTFVFEGVICAFYLRYFSFSCLSDLEFSVFGGLFLASM